jgi:hypothetical protein
MNQGVFAMERQLSLSPVYKKVRGLDTFIPSEHSSSEVERLPRKKNLLYICCFVFILFQLLFEVCLEETIASW